MIAAYKECLFETIQHHLLDGVMDKALNFLQHEMSQVQIPAGPLELQLELELQYLFL